MLGGILVHSWLNVIFMLRCRAHALEAVCACVWSRDALGDRSCLVSKLRTYLWTLVQCVVLVMAQNHILIFHLVPPPKQYELFKSYRALKDY